MARFISAIASRNSPDTEVPMIPAMSLKELKLLSIFITVTAMMIVAVNSTIEWPSEKNSPTATGRLPSCISLRVTLSMAAMWSASTA